MGKTRRTCDLVSDNNIFVDITNDRVGIGTDNPGAQLHLSGSTPIIRITDTDIVGPLHANIDGASGYLTLDVGSVHRDVIITSVNQTNEIARFTGDGKVGVNEDDPIERLHIGGAIISTGSNTTSSTGGSNRAILDFTSGGARIGHFRGTTSSGSGSLGLFVDSTEKLHITSDGNVRVPDNGKFTAGDNDDLQIFHDGATSIISGMYHPIELRHQSEVHIKCVDDGAVSLYHNNVPKLETTSYGVKFLDNVLFNNPDTTGRNLTWEADNDALHWEDNTKATFGGSNDLQIFHDGSNSYIQETGVGNLFLESSNKIYISDLDLTAISSSISDTAIDVFVYDTSKDSDGGEWRKRTQHTSWYNETLGTATRGTRKEFPAVAVIVAETTKVTIYDGDDPDLPMWMVFTWSDASVDNLLGYNDRAKSAITAVNGYLITCSDPDGIHIARFIHDDGIRYTHVNHVYTSNSIANRTNTTYRTINTTSLLVASTCNDIAATVLPNAPIDSATGLPIPTIAVATGGGVSVITDSGSVVDIYSAQGGNYNQSKAITITEENYLWWLGDYFNGSTYVRDSYAVSLVNFPTSDFTWNNVNDNMSAGKYYALTTDNEAGEIKIGPVNTWAWNIQERNALGGPSGLAIHKPNIGSETNSLIAAITSDYNTGWMHGDIKGAFLSDTDTTNVEELITNGTFDSDTTGWTSHNGATITHTTPSAAGIDTPATDGRATPSSAGIIKIVSNGSASGAYQAFTTIVGKTYTASFLAYQVNYGSNYVYIGTSINGNQNYDFYDEWDQSVSNNWASGSATFTATDTTTYISLVPSQVSGRVLYMDEIKVHLAEEDRSVNNNGLAVYGTVTKTPVATGAELVAYSGFSGSNYLQQPYNSDLVAGTGSQCFMGWVYATLDGTRRDLFSIGESDANEQFRLGLEDGYAYFDYGNGNAYSRWDTNYIPNNVWTFVVATISAGDGYGKLYINGDDKGIPTAHPADAPATFLTSTSYTLTIGNQNGTSGNHWNGSLALLRYSHTIPSAAQVKKMYDDEKILFQENAKATLYGSSDAVTALAFDDTTNLLHVGTSAGRSEFQGLRRINNTTDAVTTAISASNGLVAEQ